MGPHPSENVGSEGRSVIRERACGNEAFSELCRCHWGPRIDLTGHHTSERDLSSGEFLVVERGASTGFYRVDSGVLIASKKHFGQCRQVLRFYYPNDIVFSPPWEEGWSVSIRALTKARVEIFDYESLGQSFWKQGDVGYRLFQTASAECLRSYEHGGLLRLLSVQGRFAIFLVEAISHLGQRDGRDIVLSVPMTRIDIASYLGLRTETLSRLISRWKQQGLISVDGRHIIVVHNFKRLQLLARNCSVP